MSPRDSLQASQTERKIPAEAGVWIFIFGDMMLFGLFFTYFVYERSHDIGLFQQSQMTLNEGFGALNTFLLLTSSWLVVRAVQAARNNARKKPARLFMLGLLCGLGFCVVKVLEYSEKIRMGITLNTNDFYMYYYMFTGIHFVHVLIGIGLLTFLWRYSKNRVFTPQSLTLLETGGVYWHMVDVLWVVLFALLYLIR